MLRNFPFLTGTFTSAGNKKNEIDYIREGLELQIQINCDENMAEPYNTLTPQLS